MSDKLRQLRTDAIEAMAKWMAELNDEWADDELMWGEYLPDAENALDGLLRWLSTQTEEWASGPLILGLEQKAPERGQA